ncbi:MAG: Crp/Fnr family transcriptional regulator [Hespellia sp.]|nr:Crp/Fnr family transcriptional regulator [Hespellia sp.]
MGLRKSELFSEISSADCQKMCGCLKVERRSYGTGETICSYDEGITDIGIIESGSAQLVRLDMEGNQTMLDHLQESDIFGEVIGFSNNKEDSFWIICEKECEVAFIPYQAITKMCHNVCPCHQKLLQNLLMIVAEKAKMLSERIEVISNRSTRNKLMYYFQLQAMKNGSKKFEIPFTVTNLAEYLCVDRSAMAREISSMKEEGLLEMSRRKVELL